MKLINLIRRLGLRKLSSHFNEDFLEQYSEISGCSISEKAVAQLLFNMKGYALLKDKSFRKSIFEQLKPYEKEKVGGNPVFSWSRKSEGARNFLELLNVSVEESFGAFEEKKGMEDFCFEGEYSLFQHQLSVKHQMVQALDRGENRMLIHMPTGSGKTRVTLDSILEYYRYKKQNEGLIVWLTHSQELCEQAYETAVINWRKKGDSKLKFIKLWGNRTFDGFEVKHGFVIASLQKMYAMLVSHKDKDFSIVNHISRNACLLVVDEAHKAMAPTYKKIIEWIASEHQCPLIGLTATPGRNWNPEENRRLSDFFNSNKITILDSQGLTLENPISYLQDEGYLSKISRYKVPIDVGLELTQKEEKYLETFLDFPPEFLARLGKSSARNSIILHEILKLASEDLSSIVFTTSIDQGYLLATLINEQGYSAQMLDGTTPQHIRAKAIQQFKSGELDILLNYNILSTGFDAPNVDAIAILRPTTSIVLYNQMLGRGIRGEKVGGKKECVLIDIIDNLRSLPNEIEAFNYFNSYWE